MHPLTLKALTKHWCLLFSSETSMQKILGNVTKCHWTNFSKLTPPKRLLWAFLTPLKKYQLGHLIWIVIIWGLWGQYGIKTRPRDHATDGRRLF